MFSSTDAAPVDSFDAHDSVFVALGCSVFNVGLPNSPFVLVSLFSFHKISTKILVNRSSRYIIIVFIYFAMILIMCRSRRT